MVESPPQHDLENCMLLRVGATISALLSSATLSVMPSLMGKHGTCRILPIQGVVSYSTLGYVPLGTAALHVVLALLNH